MSDNQSRQRGSVRSIANFIAQMGVMGGLFGAASLVVEAPIVSNPFRNLVSLIGLWCAGIVSWLLTYIRVRKSRISMKTMFVVISVTALGFTSTKGALCVMGAIALALIFDFGSEKPEHVQLRDLLRRSLQATSGLTGLYYAIRVFVSMNDGGLRFPIQPVFFLPIPDQLKLTQAGQIICYAISTLLAISLIAWLLGGRLTRRTA